jgi:hypothetical protein
MKTRSTLFSLALVVAMGWSFSAQSQTQTTPAPTAQSAEAKAKSDADVDKKATEWVGTLNLNDKGITTTHIPWFRKGLILLPAKN